VNFARPIRRRGALIRCVLFTAALGISPADGGARGGEAIVISVIEGSLDNDAARAVVAEAYRRLGEPIAFRAMDAASASEAAHSGEADAALQRVAGLDREYPELLQIPIPINVIHGAAFSREYRFPVNGWSSLRPYRIGVVRGVLFSAEGTVGMDVRVAADHLELVRWIANGDVDVGVLPRLWGQHAIRESGQSEIAALDGVLETLLMYHYVHVRHKDLAHRLESVLKEMLLEGTTARLLEAARHRSAGDGS
jgi:ABC-type amino acid transport substrate-binding protein